MNTEAFYYGLQAGIEKVAEEAAPSKKDRVMAFMRKHKKPLMRGAAGAAGAGGVYAAYKMYKRRKAKKAAEAAQQGM